MLHVHYQTIVHSSLFSFVFMVLVVTVYLVQNDDETYLVLKVSRIVLYQVPGQGPSSEWRCLRVKSGVFAFVASTQQTHCATEHFSSLIILSFIPLNLFLQLFKRFAATTKSINSNHNFSDHDEASALHEERRRRWYRC